MSAPYAPAVPGSGAAPGSGAPIPMSGTAGQAPIPAERPDAGASEASRNIQQRLNNIDRTLQLVLDRLAPHQFYRWLGLGTFRPATRQ